jgi:DNA-directed RNA polymerase subunit A'
MPPPTGEQAGVQLWDNKFIFSQILPHTLNMTFRSSLCRGCENCRREQCSFDAYVSISNSTLQTGTIDKTAVGISEGEIILEFSRVWTRSYKKFIEECTKFLRALMIDGFSLDFDEWISPKRLW